MKQLSRKYSASGSYSDMCQDDVNHVYAEQNPSAALRVSPHYSDKRFVHDAQTVYGAKQDGLSYDYDDRLWQWDSDKAKRSFAAADQASQNEGFAKKSAKYFSVVISTYYGKKLEVKHVMAGVNLSNGYPYYVLGYKAAVE